VRMSLSEALQVALQRINAGQAAAAEQICRSVLDADPQNSEAYRVWGVVAYCAGDLPAALERLTRSVEIDPRNVLAHDNASMVQALVGNYAQAEASARRALALLPAFSQAENNLGYALARQQRPAEAEAAFRRALALDGNLADAHNNLGMLLQDAGRLAEAENCYVHALAIRPDYSSAWNNLGTLRQTRGDRPGAEEAYRRALALEPRQLDALNNLAQCLLNDRRLEEAATLYAQLTRDAPGFAPAQAGFATVLQAQGRDAEAVDALMRLIALQPNNDDACMNLGTILRRLGRPADAVVAYRRTLVLRPQSADAESNLGTALEDLRQWDEAEQAYRRALALRPDFPEAYYNLGGLLRRLERWDEAEEAYRTALRYRPSFAQAYNNLANVLRNGNRLAEAEAAFLRAIELEPQEQDAHYNLGGVYQAEGRVREALAAGRRALAVNPDFVDAASAVLSSLQYLEETSVATLYNEHQAWADRFARPLEAAWRPHANAPDPDRLLRLGFISPDFKRHPVSYLSVRALENIDRQRYHLVAYSAHDGADAMTARLRQTFDTWRDVTTLSDAALAEQIRADGVDILIDLAGHTLSNRLLTLARRPAPVQLHWIGYEGTTGLRALDYLLADAHLIPPGEEAFYAEEIYRLPEVYVCYDPPAYAPPIAPRDTAAEIVFGSFNNLAKIQPPVVQAWADLLHALPEARLFLKYRALEDAATRQRYVEQFQACGIGPQRLILEPAAAHGEYLDAYNRVDVALDPFPFGGGVTSCDALWMGVPVVTLRGQTFAGRHTVSYVSAVGHAEWVADDLTQYQQLALELAGDPARRAALRRELRPEMSRSALCDGRRFAQAFDAALRTMWRRWCQHTNAAT